MNIKNQVLEHLKSNFKSTDVLEQKFREHPCYSLIDLDSFLPFDIVEKLVEEQESIPLSKCKHFTRKGSSMYEHNTLQDTPICDQVVDALHSAVFLKWLQKVTDSKDLIPDPYLTGAGYARCFAGDSLKVHTDFNWCEELRLHRRINLIIYLNPEWKKEWKGSLEFYDTNNNKLLTSVQPKAGNVVIWSYHNFAYHGYPEPLACPEDVSRKSLRLFYYVSNAEHDGRNPPHRSLYWFDNKEKLPYDIPWKE